MEEMKEPIVLEWTRDEKGNVVDRHPVEVANAVTVAKRDNTQNYVLQPINTIADGCASTLTGAHHYSGNIVNPKRVQKEMGVVVIPMIFDDYNGKIREDQDTCGTLTTNCGNDAPRNGFKVIEPQELSYRIRKLTPRECFRLMGVSDADIDKIQAAGISKSQQYKMAGNSIVVNCLAAIFRQLFIGNFNKVVQTELF